MTLYLIYFELLRLSEVTRNIISPTTVPVDK